MSKELKFDIDVDGDPWWVFDDDAIQADMREEYPLPMFFDSREEWLQAKREIAEKGIDNYKLPRQ